MNFVTRGPLGRALVSLVFLSSIASAQTASTKEPQQAIDKKDTRVEPTTWGAVNGRVYDAITGAPIKGAHVSVCTDDGFIEKGRSVDDTDDLGGYRAQTVLGRVSSNLDVGRALLSSGIGLLFGSATNKTKRFDVSRVGLQITAPGYKPFEGVVVARWQDAGSFSIGLQPILLVPEGQPGVAVSATGWAAVRIESATAMPTVAKKGMKVSLIANVRAFGKNPARNVEVSAVSPLWKGFRTMKLSPAETEDGSIAFQTDYTVSGKEKMTAAPVYFVITKSVLDYNSERATSFAMVQFEAPAGEDQSALRTSALDSYQRNNLSEAVSKLKTITASSQASHLDYALLADAAESMSDYSVAADAWRHLFTDREGDDRRDYEGYAKSLYNLKEYDQVESMVASTLKTKRSEKWPEIVTGNTVGYLGLSYVKLGELDAAAKLNEDLLDWPMSGLYQIVIEFRGALRLAQVEAANAAHPNSAAALADYGRALMDLGRYEEAAAKLKESLDLDGSQIAIRRDLTWAALQMQGRKLKSSDLATAVSEAKQGLNLDGGKQRSKDFFSWNQYAILLFALSEEKRAASDSTADATRDEAISALREALSLGRVGAQKDAGAFSYRYGYMTGSEVAISGFAYPQANASFVLLDSLKHLRRDPNDYLAEFNLSSSLLDLGQTTMAEAHLEKLIQTHPEFVEAKFLSGLALLKAGQDTEAQKTLLDVLLANPRHPRAHLLLADILAGQGDVAGSAEQLALHAQYYGATMVKR